jgi:hypothetical protein
MAKQAALSPVEWMLLDAPKLSGVSHWLAVKRFYWCKPEQKTDLIQQSTSFAGFGKTPPIKAIQTLASAASFANWKLAQQVIEEVVESISTFGVTAKTLGVKPDTIRLIKKQLNNTWQSNKRLCS